MMRQNCIVNIKKQILRDIQRSFIGVRPVFVKGKIQRLSSIQTICTMAQRVSPITHLYTSEHRSLSEHLIQSNDEYWMGHTSGHGTTYKWNE